MTTIDEFSELRTDVLDASRGQDGFIEENLVLAETLPLMLDAKLVDSEDFNDSYFVLPERDIKLNGYTVNESQERLQIFLVDEQFTPENLGGDDILVSERSHYEKQFKRATRFVRSAIDGSILKEIQDADPVKSLAAKLASSQGMEQFDVIEIFLVTLSSTVSKRGQELQPRSIRFNKVAPLKVSQKVDGRRHEKEILLLCRVIDLNFMHEVGMSKGNREPLEIDFVRDFKRKIEVIEAAHEKNFESYLCVLNADVIADLYRLYSSRLLEKNVRSFLQFKGANRGIRETIRESPTKFIAFNNGLTITATDARIEIYKKKTYIESLTDFQIVNGGQTTASLYFSKKDGLDISKVRVMAKINIVKGADEAELDELISKISQYSNTQSKVSNADLRSRNPQLRQLKNLSTSVTTPSGHKWFFERAKGEFLTAMRHAGAQKASQKAKFPPARRFSKEQLAKYHTAWGDTPHLVKKGGDKVFRHFIEVISPGGDGATETAVDRTFYEELIGKIILFRQMETIYGQGKNSIGQIRSAAIPYALSCLYKISNSPSHKRRFDLGRIWKHEGVEDDLKTFLGNLLQLVNDLIKHYSMSDDFGEYSKKPELWEAIRKSPELRAFADSPDTVKILNSYLVLS